MNYENRFYVENNIVRWNSNDKVPPADCLEEMVESGLVTIQQKVVSGMVRETETQKFLENYRKQMENHVPSDEERFELRAAFGEGAKVVNAITGQEYTV